MPTAQQLPLRFEQGSREGATRRADVEAWSAVARRIAERVAAETGEPVKLRLTDNRRTMLSAKRRGGCVLLRLHHVFLRADERVWAAIGEYVREGGHEPGPAIKAHLQRHRAELARARVEATPIRTRGRHHDLARLFSELENRYFGGPIGVRITWGAHGKGPGRRRRSIKLGSYAPDEALIRVHPILDRRWVPEVFVASVVFHEMLHHVVPPDVVAGKRRYHTKTFRELERSFEGFEAAAAWEHENLARLLGFRERGSGTP